MSTNLNLIFVCLALGVLLKRTGRFPSATPQVLNQFVLWVAYPALVLIQIPALLNGIAWSWDLWIPISMGWLQFALAFLVFHVGAKHFPWGNSVAGALVLTAGFGNTSFVGFPLLEALLGPEAVRVGIIVDQPGSFLVLSSLGILYASAASPRGAKRFDLFAMMKKTFLFPPFTSLFVAALWWLSGSYGPGTTLDVLEKVSATLVPLALVAVGFQLRLSPALLKSKWRPLTAGLVFKLVLVPAFFCGLYVYVLGSRTFITKVTLLESAMAPMITSAILAEEFGFDTEVSNLMLGIGIPLSLITVWLWHSAWTF